MPPPVGPRPAPHLARCHAQAPSPPDPRVDLQLGDTERPLISPEMRTFAPRLDADSLARYPDSRALEALLAGRLGVPAPGVLVTAGGDEALDRTCRAMLAPGRTLLTTVPTLERIAHYARLAGGDVHAVPWPASDFPLTATCAQVHRDTAVIAVVSPNTPTGAVITPAALRALAHAAPRALVLLEMSFAEYADVDLTPHALALPNVLIVRTLSQAWGLPGARVGYVAGAPEVVGWLRAAGGPYTVARISLTVAHARLLDGEGDMRMHVERVRRERRELEALLQRLGVRVASSQANFVLGYFPDARWADVALLSLGIGMRAFAAEALQSARRITCPGESDAFARLRHALVAALAPQALLLSIDAMLLPPIPARDPVAGTAATAAAATAATATAAAATAATATAATATAAAATAATATAAAATAATAMAAIAAVTAADLATLRPLAARVPLVLVTRMGAVQAQRVCAAHGLQDVFRTVVSHADMGHPHGATTLRHALAQLGAEAAWMLVASSEELRAARAARIVPLCLSAGHAHAATLVRGPVARAVESIEALARLVPTRARRPRVAALGGRG